MGRNSKGVKDERRRQVALYYFLHDLSGKEISKKLDWCEDVIYADIKHLEANVTRDLKSDNIFEKIMQPFREMYKVASTNMNSAQGKEKAMWLSKMHDIHSNMVEQLFKRGILREAPKQIETKNLNLTMDMKDFGDLYERYERARTSHAALDRESSEKQHTEVQKDIPTPD